MLRRLDDEQTRAFFAAHATHERWHCHQVRYRRSAQWVQPLLAEGMHVLDIGGESPWLTFLREIGANAECTDEQELTEPLRLPRQYDVITCMEVIEHLKDRPGNREEFDGSGIKMLLAEIRKAIKPGGVLFLTTPNVGCIAGVWRLLRGEHPYGYKPHHRELSSDCLKAYLKEARFGCDLLSFEAVWQHPVPNELRKALEALPVDDDRLNGDCMFALCRPV